MPSLKKSPSHETSVATERISNTRKSKEDSAIGSNSSSYEYDDYNNNDNIDVAADDEEYDQQEQGDAGSKEPMGNSSRHGKNKVLTPFEREELIPALAGRSCHVPGNTVCQDYLQHMANNHPIFGICCHHTLHPVGTRMRLWNLFSSIMFGLTVTNCMWLWFYSQGMLEEEFEFHPSVDPSDVVFHIQDKLNWTNPLSHWDKNNNHLNTTNSTTDLNLNDTVRCIGGGNGTYDAGDSFAATSDSEDDTIIHINQGMIFLWTVGCTLHALYDCLIWYLEVCTCCARKHPDTTVYHRTLYQQCGTALVVLTTVLCAITATLAIVVRASIVASNNEKLDSLYGKNSSDYPANYTNGNNDTDVWNTNYNISFFNTTTEVTLLHDDATVYEFLISYGIELTLALFVFYPLLETILFTGFLGCCGLLPVVGGRPYEVRQAKERQKKRQLQLQQQPFSKALDDGR